MLGHWGPLSSAILGPNLLRPVAIITGPSEVSAACPFKLSAEESYDVPGIRLFLALVPSGYD
jgi:hypothetical protein